MLEPQDGVVGFPRHQDTAWLTKILVMKKSKHEDQDRSGHHGLRGGAAHALRAAVVRRP